MDAHTASPQQPAQPTIRKKVRNPAVSSAQPRQTSFVGRESEAPPAKSVEDTIQHVIIQFITR